MRPFLLILLIPLVSAFAPPARMKASTATIATARDAVSRRDVADAFISGIATAAGLAVISSPQAGMAFSQQLDENWIEPSQQATDGKVDLNSAFVVSRCVGD